jgi:hypothetical protein
MVSGVSAVRVLASLIVAASVRVVSAQTWCNKGYMQNESVIPPGGEFPIPATSSSPLLALRCGQAVRPYLPEDTDPTSDASFVSILVDTPVTFQKIVGASPISLSRNATSQTSTNLDVTVFINGKKLTSGTVPLNATKHALPFSLSSNLLTPRKAPYTLTCTATLGSQKFTSQAVPFTFLPTPDAKQIGSVTKMDMRSGALLARAVGSKAAYETLFPIGFYTDYGGYLVQNLSVIAELKSQGFNIVSTALIHENRF